MAAGAAAVGGHLDFAHVFVEVTLYDPQLRYATWVAEIAGGHVGAIARSPAGPDRTVFGR